MPPDYRSEVGQKAKNNTFENAPLMLRWEILLFRLLAGSTCRRQGSVLYYVDAILYLLVNIEGVEFAIGGDDPCRKDYSNALQPNIFFCNCLETFGLHKSFSG